MKRLRPTLALFALCLMLAAGCATQRGGPTVVPAPSPPTPPVPLDVPPPALAERPVASSVHEPVATAALARQGMG